MFIFFISQHTWKLKLNCICFANPANCERKKSSTFDPKLTNVLPDESRGIEPPRVLGVIVQQVYRPPPLRWVGHAAQHLAAYLSGHTPAEMAQVKAAGDAATNLQDYTEVYADMATVSSSAGESTNTTTMTKI